ncbi:MAG: substrate-binding domain-containing protein [Cyanobacteriota bacterium]|nr:substrate-binding domain-containing protein [Cyanobacteriota bacterium]
MITIKIQIVKSFEEKFYLTIPATRTGEDSLTTSLPRIPPELESSFKHWKQGYYDLRSVREVYTSPHRLEFVPTISDAELYEYRNSTKLKLNQWLDTNSQLREYLIRLASQPQIQNKNIRILLDLQTPQLYYFPWQEWKLFEDYFPQSEVCIRFKGSGDKKVKPISKSWKVRILLVLGNSDGIQVKEDLQIIQDLAKKGAKVDLLKNPSRENLRDAFKKEPGYHIFIFAGHSCSNEDGSIGWLELSPNDRLTIESFKDNFRRAIDRGLQLAIFNSCDGLGLAQQIARLNLPQCIVMREPIPDRVAIEFLKNFFEHFSQNKPLAVAVRETRKDLEPFEAQGRVPGAQWLPVICTRESAKPLQWRKLRRNSTAYVLAGAAILFSSIGLWLKFKPSGSLPQLARSEPCPQTMSEAENTIQNSIEEIETSSPPQCLADVRDIPSGTWLYSGSTTWAPIRGIVHPKIKTLFPDFKLRYTQHPDKSPGSGTGIQMLLDGQVSFAESSRPLNDAELRQASMRDIRPKQDAVAIDAIAVAVHPDLPIEDLTLPQLKDIYTGQIENWQQVGGPDLEIQPYARSGDSGTTEFFQSYILGDAPFSDRAIEVETPTIAIREVNQNEGGIFFGTASQLVTQCGVKPLPLRRSADGASISPYREPAIAPEDCSPQTHNVINLAAFENDEYPLVRRLFLITRQDNSLDKQAGEAYYTLLLTDEGQESIEEAGFIPIR